MSATVEPTAAFINMLINNNNQKKNSEREGRWVRMRHGDWARWTQRLSLSSQPVHTSCDINMTCKLPVTPPIHFKCHRSDWLLLKLLFVLHFWTALSDWSLTGMENSNSQKLIYQIPPLCASLFFFCCFFCFGFFLSLHLLRSSRRTLASVVSKIFSENSHKNWNNGFGVLR